MSRVLVSWSLSLWATHSTFPQPCSMISRSVMPVWVLMSLELNLFEKNHEKLSSYRESRRGSHIAINDQAERHKVLFKCDRRDILPQRNRYLSTAFCSSPNILAEAEPSTKTSIEYQFQMDSRDNPMMPLSGGLLRFRYTEFESLLKVLIYLLFTAQKWQGFLLMFVSWKVKLRHKNMLRLVLDRKRLHWVWVYFHAWVRSSPFQPVLILAMASCRSNEVHEFTKQYE